MTADEVIKHFGGRQETAKELGVSYEAVRQWDASQRVPIRRQYEIERISGGKLVPDESVAVRKTNTAA